MRERHRLRWLGQSFSLAGLLVVSALMESPALAAAVERISVSTTGEQGNADSGYPGISFSTGPCVSADGRFVAFESQASNLVPGDTNGATDVFVRDRLTGLTERASVSSAGGQSDRYCGHPAMSADGRFVAFVSSGANLVAGDTNGTGDVFVRDRLSATTERASLGANGEQGNKQSSYPAISGDGRFLAFMSEADNLVAGDTNGRVDVFVRDRLDTTTKRVSVSSAGEQGNGDSGGGFLPVAIAADGRFVAFPSDATNLVPGDANQTRDVFVHDLFTGETECVSVSSTGEHGNRCSDSWWGSLAISADGRFVAFASQATNLVPGDSGITDIFLRDRETATTQKVSVSSAGDPADRESSRPSMSADGRFIAFASTARNLVPGDTNDCSDIFVRDTTSGTTERISMSSIGEQSDWSSGGCFTSADGRFVVFYSWATNLVPGDTNGKTDVFLCDRGPLVPAPRLLINAGEPCTNSTAAVLTIDCSGWAQARFRNDPGAWGPWEVCSPARAWTLPGGDGIKRVCVQGCDPQGGESAEVCDEIILDTLPPGNLSIAIEGGTLCTDSSQVTLSLSATDAFQMRLRHSSGHWFPWWPFKSTETMVVSVPPGWPKLVSVAFKCRDSCGNESGVAEVTFALGSTFEDVTCANQLAYYVEMLLAKGITAGCSRWPSKYCPSADLSRAQMAVFLCKAAGKTPLDRPTPTFPDVPKTHWAYGYIERFCDAASWGGSAPGYACSFFPSKKFCPSASVTREQIAWILCTATGRQPTASCSGIFADVPSSNPFCRWIERLADATSWPGGVAVTSGCACPSGYAPAAKCYCPRSNVTRGQMAVFLVRAFGIPL